MQIDEEAKKFLEEKLNLSEFLSKEAIDEFYSSMQRYLKKKRIYKNSLSYRLDETIEFLEFLDLEYLDILTIIKNYPSVLHANKKDFLEKYLLLGVIKDPHTNEGIRKDILVNHSKYLIIGFKTLYARYKYLVENGEPLTKYYLLKMTNKEFENTFKRSNEVLISEYPCDDNVLNELLDLEENAIFKEKINEKKSGFKYAWFIKIWKRIIYKGYYFNCRGRWRGPLVGPVVAAAVILPKDYHLVGLNDSKKLSEKKRNTFYKIINEEAIAIGIGIVDAKTIDEINIYQASRLAMIKAINNLKIKPEHILVDAMPLDLDIPSTSIIHGDALSLSIAAASVIAKVTRDKMMYDLDEKYPEYGFKRHKGYPTKEHLEAIKKYGVLDNYRFSYKPVQEAKKVKA